jgi:alpha-tubulin suppressor-like RCC1 family protein
LCLGDFQDRDFPTYIYTLKGISQISSRYLTTLILDNNGKVYFCGTNDIRTSTTPYSLSLGNIVEISTGGYHSLAINHLGQVYSFGDNWFGQLGKL